jgi:transcriptional regulator with XRE-family HTH domain
MASSNEIIGRNLARLRANKGISQAELGRTSQISQRTVSNVEKLGESGSPTVDTVEILANYFRIPAWLMLVDNMPLNPVSGRRLDEALQAMLSMSEHGLHKVLDRIEEVHALEGIKNNR